MTYGAKPFGRTPWGGVEATPGVTLLTASPAPGSVGAAVSVPINFELTTPGEFDYATLNVVIDGVPVITSGVVVLPYTGSIAPPVPGYLSVSLNHADYLPGITVAVDIDVSDQDLIPFVINYSFSVGSAVPVAETITLTESLQVDSLLFTSIDGNTTLVNFPFELRFEGIRDTSHYTLEPSEGAVPVTLLSITPNVQTKQSGVKGQVSAAADDRESPFFDTFDGTFSSENIGDYIFITGSAILESTSFSPELPYRIVGLVSPGVVQLERFLSAWDPSNGIYVTGVGFTPGTGQLTWKHTSAVQSVTILTTESTGNKVYWARVRDLITKQGLPYSGSLNFFISNATKPRIASVQFLVEEGSVLLTYDEPMRVDNALFSVSEYQIVGPTAVSVREVRLISDRQIALITSGFGVGSYTLTVNATGTPKDAAGNPIDPTFNQAIFTAQSPLSSRSIFTDKGPLTKPDLTVQSGIGGTIQTKTTSYFGLVTLNEVVLPGGSFTSGHVGLYLDLGGSVNTGSYKVTSVVSATRLRLDANLRLPDASNGTLSWRLYEVRTGEIADDPTDVVVRVNGIPIIPDSVVGLLGQVVLPIVPGPDDDVVVDYCWIPDPTIEIRRLNSREFKLNGWVFDTGQHSLTQHSYRYRNVLISPSTFVAEDLQAVQNQPLLRELSYRAYERAYSVALNDPHLLLLNTPIHRIAYPPLSRTVEVDSVSYAADTLPELDLTSPWVRQGVGVASVSSGTLTVQDNTVGPYPGGDPLFWSRGIDLTFPSVFAMTWRLVVDSFTLDGVYTGVSIGWSDEKSALVVGLILDGGTRKIGFLKKGSGSNPALLSAWTGGVSSGVLTNLPIDLDWSILHSYRILQGVDGVIRLYVDGGVSETLRITPDELPFLGELSGPFNRVQEAFFGSLSREASNTSSWDFVRYLIQPTNPIQSAPSVFVSYEGDEFPESASSPWTPVGYHGNERVSGSTFILDSTSVTDATDVGLVGGDFKGFSRIEPLLSYSSNVVLDVNVQLRTYTHGITQDAVMAAVDDGDRLIQVCFFPTKSQPKVSYPGRSLPEDATPRPWTALGGQTARMEGRVLVIEDNSSVTDGRIYALEDLEPDGSDLRIIETTVDYYIEFKLKVVSYIPDGAIENFCGATVDVFDGTRAIGLMARQTTGGVRQLAFHSDGLLLGSGSQFAFNWFDGVEHIIRLVKSTLGDLVSLFVDGTLIGTFAYSSFNTASGTPVISFGSATAVTVAAQSVVNWHYVNVWRAQPSTGVRKYVGIWKGFDSTELTGYHLPTKVFGHASVAGNTLTDLSGDFVVAGVATGDDLVIDVGSNKGTYSVNTVFANTVTILGVFPSAPSEVDYRVVKQVDWTTFHKYRLVRDPGGAVSLLIDSENDPLVHISYGATTLPSSVLGFPSKVNQGLPSVAWGSFDPMNLTQTAWDYVRYGVTNSVSVSEDRIVPHHQVLNQRNVMSSPEHLSGSVVHGHTQFSSASTGVPYPWHDYVEDPAVVSFTRLNEGTPLVPSTQTYEVRRPTPVNYFLSGLNRPEDVLNGDNDFLLNDGATEVRLILPDDVLYDCLEVVEQTTGAVDYIAPFSDEYDPISLRLNWQKEVCGTYGGAVLPESDPDFGTDWVLDSDNPGSVSTTAFGGVLTYSSGGSIGNTVYRNPTPLTDPVGLNTKVEFNLKVLNDSTSGTGDTGIRFGFSAFGSITAALAFVTTGGDREVRLLDLANNTILASLLFDFLDGGYHVYRLAKNIEDGTVDFSIDP